jgi:hypothetical protein
MDSLQAGCPPAINQKRLQSQYSFMLEKQNTDANEFAAYFGNCINNLTDPFAFLHQH